MWITLQAADLLSGLTSPEYNAVRTAAIAGGQTGDSIVAEILSQVTTEVRGRVAACAKNTLGEAGTIPDECKAAAVDVAIFRICKRIPGKAVLTQERIDANSQALAFLRDVADCGVALVPPTTAAPGAEQAGGTAAQVVAGTTKQYTRTKLSGL